MEVVWEDYNIEVGCRKGHTLSWEKPVLKEGRDARVVTVLGGWGSGYLVGVVWR